MKNRQRIVTLLLFILIILICGGLILFMSHVPNTPCPKTVEAMNTIATLQSCMRSLATIDDVYDTLKAWGRVRDRADVQELDMLPDGSAERLVIIYPDLTTFNWDPEGQLAIFQRTDQGWWLVFNSADNQIADRLDLDWKNWYFRVENVGDFTGDAHADIALRMGYSNGMHSFIEYMVVLTGDESNHLPAAPIYPAFIDDTTNTRPTYAIGDRTIVAQHKVGVVGSYLSTRTFAFKDGNYVLTSTVRAIPQAAIDLLRDLDAHYDKIDVLGRAYNAIGNTFSYFGGKLPLDEDELPILDMINLKLSQIAMYTQAPCFNPQLPACDFARDQFVKGIVETYPLNVSARLAPIYIKVWLATHSRIAACDAMIAAIVVDVQRTLDKLTDVSRGQIKYSRSTLCVGIETF